MRSLEAGRPTLLKSDDNSGIYALLHMLEQDAQLALSPAVLTSAKPDSRISNITDNGTPPTHPRADSSQCFGSRPSRGLHLPATRSSGNARHWQVRTRIPFASNIRQQARRALVPERSTGGGISHLWCSWFREGCIWAHLLPGPSRTTDILAQSIRSKLFHHPAQ